MSSAGASVLAVGIIMPAIYLLWSLKYGKPAGDNPWHAKGLEWTIASPPPTTNFLVTPIVTEEAYAYSDMDEVEQVRADNIVSSELNIDIHKTEGSK
jgi:cytochrome c oxidase subunit 1